MPKEKNDAWMTPERVRYAAFAVLAAIVAYLCWLLVAPLVAPVAWALAFAIVAQPLHALLLRHLRFKSVAAALATVLVAVTLIAPAMLAGRQVTHEAVAAATLVQASVKEGRWRALIERNPRVAAAIEWIDATVDVPAQIERLSEQVPKIVQAVMSESLQFAFGAGVALFLLFFFLRDKDEMLAAMRGLLPLSAAEAKKVFRRVDDTIYAIIYGTLAVCLVQGALGALIFWWLGLSSPLLWGSAMAALSVVPVVGTAIVWGPAAIYLLLQGDADKALILAAWGFIIIGLVDNLLKPAIVKGRLDAHIVPVFVSILGGLIAFGAAGVILGPAVLAVALALLDIWRARSAAKAE